MIKKFKLNTSNIKLFHFLSRNGADIHKKFRGNNSYLHGSSYIHEAAKEGNLETVKKFIELGLDVNSKTITMVTPLHVASLKGHLEVVKYLGMVSHKISLIIIFGHKHKIKNYFS